MKTPEQTVRDKFEQDLNTVSTISKLTESISIPHQVCELSSVDELLNVVAITSRLICANLNCAPERCVPTRTRHFGCAVERYAKFMFMKDMS